MATPSEASPLVARERSWTQSLSPRTEAFWSSLGGHWIIFSIAFGLNEGTFKTTTGYISSMFASGTADNANIINYATVTLVAMLVATAIVDASGRPKVVIIAAECMWCLMNLLLALASVLRGFADEPVVSDDVKSYDVAYIGGLVYAAMALGGGASALAWTAQGVYFTLAARKHSYLSRSPEPEAAAAFGAVFGFVELGFEALCRVGVALVLTGAAPRNGVDASTYSDPYALLLLALLSAVGALTTCFLADLTPLSDAALAKDARKAVLLEEESKAAEEVEAPVEPPTLRQAVSARLGFGAGTKAIKELEAPPAAAAAAADNTAGSAAAAASSGLTRKSCGENMAEESFKMIYLLCTSLTACLLAMIPLLKGLNETFISDYVNGEVVSPSYGSKLVGYLSALGLVPGAVIALCSGYVIATCGRGYVIVLGILAFWLNGLVIFLLKPPDLLTTAQIYIPILLYTGYGVGRGVVDSALRAICASLFPVDLAQIFALLRFAEGVAAVATFGLCPCALGEPLAVLITGLGAVALVSYWLAEHINGYGARPARA